MNFSIFSYYEYNNVHNCKITLRVLIINHERLCYSKRDGLGLKTWWALLLHLLNQLDKSLVVLIWYFQQGLKTFNGWNGSSMYKKCIHLNLVQPSFLHQTKPSRHELFKWAFIDD